MRQASLILGLALLATFPGASAWAETSAHERLGVLDPRPWTFSLGLDLDAWPQTESGFSSELGLGLSASWLSLLSFSLHLPFELSLGPGGTEAQVLWPGLSISLGFRQGSWRHSLAMGLYGGRPGEGPRMALSLQSLRYLDPLLLGAAFLGGSRMPNHRGYGDENLPLSLGLRLWATEALNSRVSASCELGQSLALPAPGASGLGKWTYRIAFTCSLLVVLDHGGFSWGFTGAPRPHFLASGYGELRVGREKGKETMP